MHGSLLHLGWPLLCVRLGEGLRSPMALARLEAELDGADAGGGGLLTAEGYASSVAGRCADTDAVSLRLREQDGLAAMLAVQAMREGGSPGLAEALGLTSDLLEVALRAGRALMLEAAELYAVLQQLRAAAVCVDLYAAAREERGYAGDPGVAAIGLRISELRVHRELMTTLGRSLGPEGPDGAPAVVDGASPGLARARGRVRELRVGLTKLAQRLIKQPGIAEALQGQLLYRARGAAGAAGAGGRVLAARGGGGDHPRLERVGADAVCRAGGADGGEQRAARGPAGGCGGGAQGVGAAEPAGARGCGVAAGQSGAADRDRRGAGAAAAGGALRRGGAADRGGCPGGQAGEVQAAGGAAPVDVARGRGGGGQRSAARRGGGAGDQRAERGRQDGGVEDAGDLLLDGAGGAAAADEGAGVGALGAPDRDGCRGTISRSRRT
jgi:hypothetical protein